MAVNKRHFEPSYSSQRGSYRIDGDALCRDDGEGRDIARINNPYPEPSEQSLSRPTRRVRGD